MELRLSLTLISNEGAGDESIEDAVDPQLFLSLGCRVPRKKFKNFSLKDLNEAVKGLFEATYTENN